MIGQQQAQAHHDLRGESKQQGGGTVQQNSFQHHDGESQPKNEADRRDVSVVAVLGYN